MDAILIAGGIPQPGEPLYEYTQGKAKALLDIAGKPMVQWVLDALNGAGAVENVVLIGLPEGSQLTYTKPVRFIPNQGEMLENIRAGVSKVLELNPSSTHTLLVSSDIPAITPQIVEWIIHTAEETDHDVYYTVIRRQDMEARFPGANRSYTRLKDVEVCGGDINVIRSRLVTENEELWRRLIDSRKSVFKQAALIGYDTLLLLLLRRIALEAAVKRASRRLHVKGRAVVCPFAEAGMDVDKPHQLEIMRADLARQAPVPAD